MAAGLTNTAAGGSLYLPLPSINVAAIVVIASTGDARSSTPNAWLKQPTGPPRPHHTKGLMWVASLSCPAKCSKAADLVRRGDDHGGLSKIGVGAAWVDLVLAPG